ncbi:hypothetical protein [Schleiferilactobacillus shenzhenensis]|uniref:Uncharacterized protein n=1 Tax=Schleiferilactobacillus shenzhenensis LY-73 TaxID=1231336 RepID=U4TSU4_9LACO|nr:hypothetical protein [Schleiferilactobacillus shenzhenensis]ERL64943.1 hypothetical protein L248_3105 [Schleiferilactobacillus shenzhenensis LY-73]
MSLVLHWRYWRAIILAAVVEGVMLVGSVGRIARGLPIFIVALAPNFSAVAVLSLFLPVVGIGLAYVLLVPTYFSSVREWWLLRQGRSRVIGVVGVLMVAAVAYTVTSWLVAATILAVALHGHYWADPLTSGIGNLLGPISTTLFLLFFVVLIVLVQFASVPLVMLLVRKKWQVFVIALALIILLPILLFMLQLLPEPQMPVNIYHSLIMTPHMQWPAVWNVVGYQLLLLAGESLLVGIIIIYKNHRGWVI